MAYSRDTREPARGAWSARRRRGQSNISQTGRNATMCLKFSISAWTGADSRGSSMLPCFEPLEGRCLFSTAGSDAVYIGDGADDSVKKFDAQSGAYLGTFV